MNIILYTHIILGTLGLLAGVFVILLQKGDKRHRFIGKIFSYNLGLSMLASFPISFYKENIFLFCIGVWTLYMIITGQRSLQISDIKKVTFLDWIITLIMAVFGVLLVGIGFYQLSFGLGLPIVSMVFGFLSLLFVWTDFSFFKGRLKAKNAHQLIHIQRMMGAFISALTAFVVVNNTMLPGLVVWLLPTVFLTPLIVMWSRKWAKF